MWRRTCIVNERPMDPIQTFNTRLSNVCVAVTATRSQGPNAFRKNAQPRLVGRLARDLGHACPQVVNRQPYGLLFR